MSCVAALEARGSGRFSGADMRATKITQSIKEVYMDYRLSGLVKCSALFILPILVLFILSGCVSIVPQVSRAKIVPLEKPISVPYQQYRVEQYAINTPPIYSVRLFHQAVSALADRVDGSINVNMGGEAIYVNLITHDSIQGTVLSLKVPSFPADPPAPAKPKLGDDPYTNAQAQSDYQKAFDIWQAQLIAQHKLLSGLRAEVKVWTNKLRVLPAPYDPIADDLLGFLADASQHFQNVNGDKYLFIASPLLNNTLVNKSNNISLAGVNVRVIYRTCAIASVCAASDAYWSHIFKQYGARSVKILDPAQSEVEKPTF